VVILLLYSGRAFDETDREIIFEKVRGVGVGKIIIAVNKYDVDIEKGELESAIQNYVKEQISKAVREKNDAGLNKLLGNPNPILISAYMALLAKKSLPEIQKNETELFHYKRLCDMFEISSQKELFDRSFLKNLQDEIDNLLRKEKIEILVTKSINEIRGKIDACRVDYDKVINEKVELIKTLSLDPAELDEKQHDCERAKKKIDRTIRGLENDLKDFVEEKIANAVRGFEKKRASAITSIQQCINSAKTGEEAKPRVDSVLLQTQQDFKDEYATLHRSIKTELKSKSEETISELEEIIDRYADEEDEGEKSKDYIESCKEALREFSDMSLEDMFATDSSSYVDDEGWGTNGFGAIVGGFLTGATFGIFRASKLHQKFTWSVGGKKDALENVENMLPPVDVLKASLSPLYERVEEFIEFFRGRFEKDLIDVILQQLEDAKADFANREKNKREAEAELAKQEAGKKRFEEQATETNAIVGALLL
jgi:hypothetical protein